LRSFHPGQLSILGYDIMKRELLVLTLLVVLIAPLCVPVVAVPEHNLAWGVAIGEEQPYVLQRKYIDPDWETTLPGWMEFVLLLDEGARFTINVTALDEIPDEISADNYPNAHCDIIRDSDSEVIEVGSTYFVFPINDWEYLTQVLNESATSDVQFVNEEDEWGIVQAGSYLSGSTTVNYLFEWHFEKVNGTLNYVRFKNTALGSDLVDVVFAHWYEGMPTILPADLQLTFVLILAIASIACVTAVVLVYKWVGSKKTLAQRLGE
jgi:hypothetical protein